jgi:DNA-binding response OmpR family regulator
MIVDDELDFVRILKIYLEKKGFQVDTFTDANLALQHFRNEVSPFNANPFDLMVLDIRMPRMNGFELYSKIKEHDSSIRVCFTTVLDELQEYNQYRVEVSPATGKRHFVQKPIMNEQLLDQIISML